MANLQTIFRRKLLNQTVVWWPKLPGSDQYGKPQFGPPQQLACREEIRSQELLMPSDRKIVPKSYLFMINEVFEGDLIWPGTLNTGGPALATDWQSQSYYPNIPTVNEGAKEVMKVNAIPGPTKRDIGTVYEVYLG